jgi:5-formyltetrahydrofolate cyclo-ligase
MDRQAERVRLRAMRKAHIAVHGPPNMHLMAALALPHLADFPVVGSYCAVGSELDPALLEAVLRLRGQTIALPIVTDAKSPLHFAHYEASDELTAGPIGSIPQPLRSAPQVAPDALLVPLLAIDRRGFRLGQGAGHYDRTIASLRPIFTVGLAYDLQIVEHVADEPWDEPLDAILTPTQWITARR